MAGRVDDERRREPENAGGVHHVAVVVEQDRRVGQVMFGQERSHRRQAGAVGGDSDDGDGAAGGQRVEFGEFAHAGDAPGCPEIQHQGLAEVGFQGGGGASQGEQRQVWERGGWIDGDGDRGMQVRGVRAGGIAWGQGGQ